MDKTDTVREQWHPLQNPQRFLRRDPTGLWSPIYESDAGCPWWQVLIVVWCWSFFIAWLILEDV